MLHLRSFVRPRSVFIAAAAFAVLTADGLVAPREARAHFILQSPDAWWTQDSLGSPQKAGPCGDEGGGSPTGKITTFQAGQTITIGIQEMVFHPGHYRVALALKDRSELPPDPSVTPANTPCGTAVVESPPVFPVLADGVLDHTMAFNGPQMIQVKLPSNVSCTKCTLQIIEFMSNHGLNNPGGCFYHHCADIAIQAPMGSGGSGAGGAGATTTTSTTSASVGSGGAGQTSGQASATSGPTGAGVNQPAADSGSKGGCSVASRGADGTNFGFVLAAATAACAAARRRRRTMATWARMGALVAVFPLTTACTVEEIADDPSSGPPPAPTGVPLLGNYKHDPAAVEITVIANAADRLDVPRDLAFNPARPNELWIVNRGDESMVVITNPGEPTQTAKRYKGEDSHHFLAQPAALAFNEDGSGPSGAGTFATIHETDKLTQGNQTPAQFMGPTLWTSDLSVFDAGVNGHIDMLHHSPDGMGIAWEKDNVYWVFNGYHGAITRYDFQQDHGPGGTDHSDGLVSCYVQGQVKRQPDIRETARRVGWHAPGGGRGDGAASLAARSCGTRQALFAGDRRLLPAPARGHGAVSLRRAALAGVSRADRGARWAAQVRGQGGGGVPSLRHPRARLPLARVLPLRLRAAGGV